ncbi:MAG: amidohydrolase family protein, partial [Pyrodictiaceae archaeon]
MPPQSRPIKICGSRLFDGREIVENGCVVFNGSRIVSVGSPGSIEAPSDAESYELRGYTILPGLVDAHVHYTGFRSGDYIKESLITPFGVFVARAIRDLERTLEAGYTTVVDAGGVVALHLKRAVE